MGVTSISMKMRNAPTYTTLCLDCLSSLNEGQLSASVTLKVGNVLLYLLYSFSSVLRNASTFSAP